jgi:intein-encoded DNA endonuclease-like protein
LANPNPELAYVIGVILSDGNLNIHGYSAELILAVTDYEFATEFSRCLSIVLQREQPYTVRWHARKNRWVVQGSSVLLYNFLNRDWSNLKKWIEHCDKCAASFLKAFYDGEGCISGRRLTIHNTRRDLLVYVQRLLAGFNIEPLPLRIASRAGTWLNDPRTRRSYCRKRNCLSFAVRARSLPKFTQCIGFTIFRKQARLLEANNSQW